MSGKKALINNITPMKALAIAVTIGVMMFVAMAIPLLMDIPLFHVSDTMAMYVPSSDIPAYHLISNGSFINQPVKRSLVPNGTIVKSVDLAGPDLYYTTAELSNGTPALSSSVHKLPRGVNLSNDVVIAKSMPVDIISGIGVRAGDMVDFMALDENKTPCWYNDTFVMDVKLPESGGPSGTCVLVLAMSSDNASRFISEGSGASFNIVKKAVP